jgi:hypothetical protein
MPSKAAKLIPVRNSRRRTGGQTGLPLVYVILLTYLVLAVEKVQAPF